MSQSVNRKIGTFALLCLLLLITVALLFYFGIPDFSLKLRRVIHQPLTDINDIEFKEKLKSMDSPQFWKNVDLRKEEIPSDLIESAKHITVSSKTIIIENGQVFYRESNPHNANAKMDILFLHGMAFSSKTWSDLGTLQLSAAFGYRTVAIDIPSFGNSPKNDHIKDRAEFLRSLIMELKLKSPVIISPSYSGYFTLPYIIKYWNELSGYVPVAPVGHSLLLKNHCSNKQVKEIPNLPDKLKHFLEEPYPNLDCIKLPAMVVYGERDESKGMTTTALLSLLPNSQLIEIPNGKHPAYLSDPNLWHQLIYNFFKLINSS